MAKVNGVAGDLLAQVESLQKEVDALRTDAKQRNSTRHREDYASHLDTPATYVNQFSCQTVRGLLRVMLEETLDNERVAHRMSFVTDLNAAHALATLLMSQVDAAIAANKLAESPAAGPALN